MVVGVLFFFVLVGAGLAVERNYVFINADINGTDLNVGHVVARDGNIGTLFVGNLFSTTHINILDMNVLGDLNAGDANFSSVGVSKGTYLNWLYGTGDFNFYDGVNDCSYDISVGSFECGGDNTSAVGGKSVSFGQYNSALGAYSGALYGFGNTASGDYSVVGGNSCEATQNYAICFGNGSEASGENGVAIGSGNVAGALSSVAIGSGIRNFVSSSVALGRDVNVQRDLWVGRDLNVVRDVNVLGSVKATAFYGSGAGLTGVAVQADINAQFVPYVSATKDVNLGANDFNAKSGTFFGKLRVGATLPAVDAYEFIVNTTNGGIILNRNHATNEAFIRLTNNTANSGGQVRGLSAGGIKFTNDTAATTFLTMNSTTADFQGLNMTTTGTGTFGSTNQAILGSDSSYSFYGVDGTTTTTLNDGTYAVNAVGIGKFGSNVVGDNQVILGDASAYAAGQFYGEGGLYNATLGGDSTIAPWAGYFWDNVGGNTVTLADSTYAINATGLSYFTDGTRTVSLTNGSQAGAFSDGMGFTVNLIDGGSSVAAFDGTNTVYLVDGTYAINAVGNSLFTGDLTTTGAIATTGTGVFGKVFSTGDVNAKANLRVGGDANVANDLNVMSSLSVGKGIWMQKGLYDGDMNVDQNVFAKRIRTTGDVNVGRDLNVVRDVNVLGSVKATAFYGSGAGLAGIASAADINAQFVPYISATKDVNLGNNTLITRDLNVFRDANIMGDLNVNRNAKIKGTITGKKFISTDANSAFGTNAVALGNGTTAFGAYNTAMGSSTIASGTASTAMGSSTAASGDYSTAIGLKTTASGYSAIAMGAADPTVDCTADITSGNSGSLAGGYATSEVPPESGSSNATISATGLGAFAFGHAKAEGNADNARITALGTGSRAGGYMYLPSVGEIHSISAANSGSFAFGFANAKDIISSGQGSVAMGYSDSNLAATGTGAIALGYNVQSLAEASVTLGKNLTNYYPNSVLVQDLNVRNDLNVMSSLSVGRDANMQVGLSDGDINAAGKIIARGDANIAGSVKATAFFGSGASLTGVAVQADVNAQFVPYVSATKDVNLNYKDLVLRDLNVSRDINAVRDINSARQITGRDIVATMDLNVSRDLNVAGKTISAKLGVGTANPVVPFVASADGSTPAAALYNASADGMIVSNSGNQVGVRFLTAENTTAGLGSALSMLRSRGTLASPTVVQSGDSLGILLGQGYDGAARRNSSAIYFNVDGTPGSGDMPGRIEFQTTPDGSATLGTKWTIDNAGTLKSGTDGTSAYNITTTGYMQAGSASTYRALIGVHGANAAGYFLAASGARSVLLADASYAVNATGDSLFTGDLTTTGTGTFGSTYQAVLGDDAGTQAGYFINPGAYDVALATSSAALYTNDIVGSHNAHLSSSTEAGYFGDGTNTVYLADGTYAINAVGITNLDNGNIYTDGAGNLTAVTYNVPLGSGVTDTYDDGTDTTITFTGGIATAISTAYDERLMKDVNYLAQDGGLQPIEFKWNETGLRQFPVRIRAEKAKTQIAFKAQDVNAVYPQCVQAKDMNITGKIVPYLQYNGNCVAAMSGKKIASLEKRIAALEMVVGK